MSLIDLTVPDIGDSGEVDVIEVLVQVGDTVEVEQSLITVESDKASMEIPAAQAGVIKELLVKVGDKVSQGSAIANLEVAEGQAAPAAAAKQDTPKAAAPAAAAAPAPQAASHQGGSDDSVDVVVLGAGPGGYNAAFRAADLGLKVALVERYSTLGGVCLNVGCIPSKALLHTVAVYEEAKSLATHGIKFGEAQIDIDALRDYKNKVIGKLTGGLAGMAKGRKVQVVVGNGQFLDPNHIEVTANDGTKKVIKFGSAIIAAGSQSVKLPFLPDDPRVVDSTGALELKSVPKRMLNCGGWHHRSGNGYGVLGSGRTPGRGGNANWLDAGRRPRRGQGVGEDEQAPL